MASILFVCTGNICRSPTAEGLFRHRVNELGLNATYDSAGTHGYHVGEAPDYRSIEMAESKGVNMDGLSARKLILGDFDSFDFLIAMDKGHERIMREFSPIMEHQERVKLLLDYHEDYQGMDVPDPYYGDMRGFEHTYNLIEKGIDAMIKEIF